MLACSSVSSLVRLFTMQRMKLWENKAGTLAAGRPGNKRENTSNPKYLGMA